MTSHLAVLAVFSLIVSTVFAVLLRDEPRQQIKTAGWMFGAFIATALAMGWLLYPLPL
jgi:hypothetical protein